MSEKEKKSKTPDKTVADPVPEAGLTGVATTHYEVGESTRPEPFPTREGVATAADTAPVVIRRSELDTAPQDLAFLRRDIRPEQLPTVYKDAYIYLSDVIWDLETPEYTDMPVVADAVEELRSVRKEIERIVPRSYVATHVTHRLDSIEAQLAAAGVTLKRSKPAFLVSSSVEPKEPYTPTEASTSGFEMNYEMQRSMAQALHAYFAAVKNWEDSSPQRPAEEAGQEAMEEWKAEKAEWEKRGEEIEMSLSGMEFQIAPGRIFKIARKIGSGGMGEVFSAVDRRGRKAVLKLSRGYRYRSMHPENGRPGRDFPRVQIRETMALHYLNQEFSREHATDTTEPLPIPAYLGSQQILDPGTPEQYEARRATPVDQKAAVLRDHHRNTERFAVLVQEKIDGPTLREILVSAESEKGKFAIQDVLGYAEQLLEATSWMHMKGVYHRDLKPMNVIFDMESGHLRVIDFGGAIMPEVVERQAERIQAHDVFPVLDGKPPVYGREPSVPVMTPFYAPDYELNNDYYASGGYSENLGYIRADEQKELVKRHAARRDNYAIGMMVHQMLELVAESDNDDRMDTLQYIAGKLLSQNATQQRHEDYFSLHHAHDLLAADPAAVRALPDFEAMVQAGNSIAGGKRQLIQEFMNKRAKKGEVAFATPGSTSEVVEE